MTYPNYDINIGDRVQVSEHIHEAHHMEEREDGTGVMVSVATMKGEVVGFDTNQKFPIAVRLDGDAVNEAWFFDAEDLEVIK